MKIYVGNISRDASEEDIKTLFEEYGEVVSVKLIRDNATNALKGFGFIEMSNDSESENAIEALNGKSYKDRPLTVSVAKPKTDDRRGGFKSHGNKPFNNRDNNRRDNNTNYNR